VKNSTQKKPHLLVDANQRAILLPVTDFILDFTSTQLDCKQALTFFQTPANSILTQNVLQNNKKYHFHFLAVLENTSQQQVFSKLTTNTPILATNLGIILV